MITEDQLEQLAIQWFQDTGWNYVHGAVIAPEGVASEREALRTLTPALSHGEKEEDGRLAEAVRRFGSRQISRQSVARVVVDDRDMNRDIVSRFMSRFMSRFGGDSEAIQEENGESRHKSRQNVGILLWWREKRWNPGNYPAIKAGLGARRRIRWAALSGLGILWVMGPRALPWAVLWCPVGAEEDGQLVRTAYRFDLERRFCHE